MKKNIIVSLLILISVMVSAQQNEEELQSELYLSDEQFEQAYLNKFNSVDKIKQAYFESDNIKLKLIYLKKISELLPDDLAFETLYQVMSERFVSYKNHEAYWKIRGAAIYFLGEKGKQLSEEKQIQIIKEMVYRFNTEKDPHIVAVTAYSLPKLATDEPDQSFSKFLNKRTISYLFAERLIALKDYENFLCIHIVNASIRLNDSDLLLALKEIRKRRFHPKVLERIDKALELLQ